jgi:stage II sporulation protein AA (anti-sigma F factor antagonist)
MPRMQPEEIAFSVEVEETGDAAVVTPRGELDLATQAQLRDVLEAHTGRGSLTLDLSALGFLDTSGMRLILETAEAARRDGFDFTVVPGGPAVQRLFEVAGVSDLIPFRDGPDRGAS